VVGLNVDMGMQLAMEWVDTGFVVLVARYVILCKRSNDASIEYNKFEGEKYV